MPRRKSSATKDKDTAHLERCMSDLEFYSKTHLKIRSKQAQLVPFKFNEAQRIVHAKLSEQFKEKGYVKAIVLKARQEGVSTYLAARNFRLAHLWPNQRVTVIAHEKDKSAAIFEFYQRMYDNLIDPMKVPKLSSQRGNVLHLQHDSQIVVDTAMDEDAGAGTTIQALHASEVARWPNAKNVFISIAQAVPDVGSEIVLESTAEGIGNFFHEQWIAAEQGESGYVPIFLPWWIQAEYSLAIDEEEREHILASKDDYERQALDEGFFWEGAYHKLSPEQLAWRKKVGIPGKCAGDIRKFKAQYPTTSKEAFVATGDTFFDKDALERYDLSTKPYARRGSLKLSKRSTITLREDAMGHLRVWELPKPGGMYVIGADTASGKLVASGDQDDERGGRDFSSADVIDAKTSKQVAQLHGRMPPKVFAEQLNYLGYFYGSGEATRWPALIAVERNYSSGITVLKTLQEEFHYPNLYFGRQTATRNNRLTPQLGWITSKSSRKPLLEGLAEEIREESLAIPCAETIREMYTFVIDDKGVPRATEGTHDDRVISLAIARWVARSMGQEPPRGEIEPVPVFDTPTGAMDYGWS